MTYLKEDTWWKDWLLSKELFETIQVHVPKTANQCCLFGIGTIFQYCKYDKKIDIYMDKNSIVVAYFGILVENIEQKMKYFEKWLILLNHPPLQLGKSRDFSLYGAIKENNRIDIKWAQAGDWAIMFKNLL